MACPSTDMNSLGKSSKWPSYDSLSSTPSLLLSESEHTEDEADIFSSEGEGEGAGRPQLLAGSGAAVSRIRFAFSCHSSDLCREPGKSQSQSFAGEATPLAVAPSPATAAALGCPAATAGDMAFAKKCVDLQRFISPLIELLNGLKTGRFDRGLTSFQQSVAIDRLQRILGILQKPDMGEKYLRTLLQVEILLRMWFPQMAAQSSIAATPNVTPTIRTRWRQNQLHMPVKKRKMSWLDPDPSNAASPHHQQEKQHQPGEVDTRLTETSNKAGCTSLPRAPDKQRHAEEGSVGAGGCGWTYGHGLTEDADPSRGPAYSCSAAENGGNWKRLKISAPSPCRSLAMQDGSVSSSCTSPVADSP